MSRRESQNGARECPWEPKPSCETASPISYHNVKAFALPDLVAKTPEAPPAGVTTQRVLLQFRLLLC